MIAGFIAASLFIEDFEHVIASFLVIHKRELLDQGALQFGIGFFSCQSNQICSIAKNEQRLDRGPAQPWVFLVGVDLHERRASFCTTERAESPNGALAYFAVAFCGGNVNQFIGIASDTERLQYGLFVINGRS